MKTILILLTMSLAFSCGKSDNKVNSAATTNVSGNNSISNPVQPIGNFEGTYQLVETKSGMCAYDLTITAECNGYRINNQEDFCNVQVLGNGVQQPNIPPIPPTQYPTYPGQYPQGQNGQLVVTLEQSLAQKTLKAEVPGMNIKISNTLTLNSDGILVKTSNFKSAQSEQCVYRKTR